MKYKLLICATCGESGIDEMEHIGFCKVQYEKGVRLNAKVAEYEVPRKIRRLVTCPVCGLSGRGRLFPRFHFDKCKWTSKIV